MNGETRQAPKSRAAFCHCSSCSVVLARVSLLSRVLLGPTGTRVQVASTVRCAKRNELVTWQFSLRKEELKPIVWLQLHREEQLSFTELDSKHVRV